MATLPQGADGFTSQDGAKWLRIVLAPEIVGAMMASWWDALPTDPPQAVRTFWNNGGSLSRTGSSL